MVDLRHVAVEEASRARLLEVASGAAAPVRAARPPRRRRRTSAACPRRRAVASACGGARAAAGRLALEVEHHPPAAARSSGLAEVIVAVDADQAAADADVGERREPVAHLLAAAGDRRERSAVGQVDEDPLDLLVDRRASAAPAPPRLGSSGANVGIARRRRRAPCASARSPRRARRAARGSSSRRPRERARAPAPSRRGRPG